MSLPYNIVIYRHETSYKFRTLSQLHFDGERFEHTGIIYG